MRTSADAKPEDGTRATSRQREDGIRGKPVPLAVQHDLGVFGVEGYTVEVSNLLAPTRQGALEQEVLALREAVEDSEVYTLVPRSPRVRKMSVVRRKK